MDGSNAVALLMYSALYIFLVLLFVIWMYFIICQCNQFPVVHTVAVGPTIVVFSTNPHGGLEDSTIETFPKFTYGGVDMNMDTDMKTIGECSVCLGVFQESEMLRLLPKCGHVFHADCVDIWLRSHSTCPFCRANLLLMTDGDRSIP